MSSDCQITGRALPPPRGWQYDERHGFLGDDLPVFSGFGHFWAKEAAGDRASSGQGSQRVPPGFERVQSSDRVGDFAVGNGKSSADSAPVRTPDGNGGRTAGDAGIRRYSTIIELSTIGSTEL